MLHHKKNMYHRGRVTHFISMLFVCVFVCRQHFCASNFLKIGGVLQMGFNFRILKKNASNFFRHGFDIPENAKNRLFDVFGHVSQLRNAVWGGHFSQKCKIL